MLLLRGARTRTRQAIPLVSSPCKPGIEPLPRPLFLLAVRIVRWQIVVELVKSVLQFEQDLLNGKALAIDHVIDFTLLQPHFQLGKQLGIQTLPVIESGDLAAGRLVAVNFYKVLEFFVDVVMADVRDLVSVAKIARDVPLRPVLWNLVNPSVNHGQFLVVDNVNIGWTIIHLMNDLDFLSLIIVLIMLFPNEVLNLPVLHSLYSQINTKY